MKKIITLFFLSCFTLIGQAQVSKTINISTAGTLSTVLTPVELNTVTNLTITGTIDARDFVTMRDVMPVLANIDLSGATITGYSGSAGPAGVKALGFGAKNTAIVPDPLRKISAQQVQLLEKATATNTVYPANEIPQNAFCKYPGKQNLNAVTIPSSVTSIGSAAFANCNGLTSITIPSSVTSIGSVAFSDCSGLMNITIPSSVTSIGSYAFSDCSGLTSVTIPSSVTSIGDAAFATCSGLTSVTIPSSVTSIGSGAFEDCFDLTSINVETTNPNYSDINGVLFDKNQLTLIEYPGGKTGNYTIPSSVTSIGSAAFASCIDLTSITIPSSVITIGDEAFIACSGLTSITIPSSVITIVDAAFSGCSGLTSVTIPSSVITIGDEAFSCSGLTSINVETTNPNYSGVNGVLFDKNQLTLIQYPGGKTGSYTIPSSVTTIEDGAFFACSGLTSVTIPSSVTSIVEWAFAACSGLTSVTIPSSVTSIGSWAFYSCSGLTSIYAYSTLPVDISTLNGVFDNVNKTTCILYVPIGSKSLYQAAAQWQDFTNIVEKTTAVPTVINESISIYPNPVTDRFRINGLEGTSSLRITDLSGKVILQKQVIENENVSVTEFPAGMYMINLFNNGVSYQKKVIKSNR